MRLRPSIEVSDAARRMIARMQPECKTTARGHLATRAAVIAYIQARLDTLNHLSPWWDDEPLSPTESADASAAIQYLRHAQKTEGEIRAWLFLQRARYDLRKGNGR